MTADPAEGKVEGLAEAKVDQVGNRWVKKAGEAMEAVNYVGSTRYSLDWKVMVGLTVVQAANPLVVNMAEVVI